MYGLDEADQDESVDLAHLVWAARSVNFPNPKLHFLRWLWMVSLCPGGGVCEAVFQRLERRHELPVSNLAVSFFQSEGVAARIARGRIEVGLGGAKSPTLQSASKCYRLYHVISICHPEKWARLH